jgi:hypothetical protein
MQRNNLECFKTLVLGNDEIFVLLGSASFKYSCTVGDRCRVKV